MTRYHVLSYLALLAQDPAVGSGAEPALSLYFDDNRLDIRLTDRSMYLSCDLLRLEAPEGAGEAFLSMLLEANSLARGAGGALFLVDEANLLRVRGQILLEGLELDELSEILEDFLNHVDFWRQLLAALPKQQTGAAPVT